MAFGSLLDRIGAPLNLVLANTLVLLGCILQAVSATILPSIPLLLVARVIIGMGGEATAFSNVESLSVSWNL